MKHFPIIDAHQHFWDLQHNDYPWLCNEPLIAFRYGDYRAIRHNYLPDDYRADAKTHHIVKTVHMEAEWNPDDPVGETRWLDNLRQRHGLPHACVAQAWLDRDDIDRILAAQAQYSFVRGIRHKPQAATSAEQIQHAAPGSMSDPRWRTGYALLSRYNLSFDLQVPYWHLYEAAELARDFPQTLIILNHTGLPADRSAKGLQAWQDALSMFAQAPNTVVKISGLGLPDHPWTVANNRPVVLAAIDIFGVDRCLFASNFPVDSLVADFSTIMGGFQIIVQDFSDSDQRKLFHDNAARIYALQDEP